MNKHEALKLMRQGEKMSHFTFDPDEYISINKNGEIEDNTGNAQPGGFLYIKSFSLFHTGWKRFEGNTNKCNHKCEHVAENGHMYCSNCREEL